MAASRSRTIRVVPSRRCSSGRTEVSLSTTAIAASGTPFSSTDEAAGAACAGSRSGVAGSRIAVAVADERQRRDAGAAGLVRVEVGQNLVGGLRLLGQHQLQVMAQGRLDGRDVLVRHANLVGQRAEHMLRLLERGERAGAEALVVGLQLLEHVQPGAFPGLLLQDLVLLPRPRAPVPPGARAAASAAPRPCRAGFAR